MLLATAAALSCRPLCAAASTIRGTPAASSLPALVRPACRPLAVREPRGISIRPVHHYSAREPKVDVISNSLLENKPYVHHAHRTPVGLGDWTAYGAVRFLRVFADLFFKKKYGHRAIVLETVAGVPGMVGAVFRHLRSLRRMEHDGGWVQELLLEAENERMHLLVFMRIFQPSLAERMLVLAVQATFITFYSVMYALSPKWCHRFVGFLEEQAVVSYDGFLESIDKGQIENVPAPALAISYWNLGEGARLREVVAAVRADEARHRDVNWRFADAAATGTAPDIDRHVPFTPSEVDASYLTKIDASQSEKAKIDAK